jgi:hypothetical protein
VAPPAPAAQHRAVSASDEPDAASSGDPSAREPASSGEPSAREAASSGEPSAQEPASRGEPSAMPRATRTPRQERLLRAGRLALLIAGVVTLAVLVHASGAERVLQTLIGAAAFMPLVIVCDLGFFACEALAHRAVLGPGRDAIPLSRFARSSFLYYCVLAIAPLGRAGAEVARATSFAPWVGAGRATAAGANVQGGVLLANLAISLPCWVAVAATVGPGHPLAWLLLVNGAATGIAGAVMLLVVRRSRVGAWLGRRVPRLAKMGAELDDACLAPRRDVAIATAWCCAARAVQIGMYAALLAAIGASVTFGGTLVALGVHLVGAGFGDLVPNQMGILEGAYRVFADAVGLAHDPARAISIALLARVSQFLVAGAGMLVLLIWRDRSPVPAAAEPVLGRNG